MSQGRHSHSSSYNYRRYATLEESEAVLPVFNTPINMYLNHPQPKYTSSPNSQSRYTPSSSSYASPQSKYTSSSNSQSRYTPSQQNSKSHAFDPLYSNSSASSSPMNGHYNNPEPTQRKSESSNNSTPSANKTKDGIVAQLVDMGFEAWQSRIAAEATNDLQEALDLLVQNQKTETNSSDDDDNDLWKKKQEERKRDYLNEIKPQTPPFDPIAYANNERKQGNFAFNKGQFFDSEKCYTLAINALPSGHGDLVLLLNNRAAAYIKQGKFNECLKDCTASTDLAYKQQNNNTTPIMQETGTNMKAQLLKALHRKACAYEGLRMYKEGLEVYEEYVRIDGSRNTQVMQGLSRCQQATASWKPPSGDGQSAFPNIDISIFMNNSSTKLSQAELDEINNSKAVKEMREREKQKEAEETEKLLKEDQVDARISAWKSGKERNLRALLSSLESILWEGVQWKPVMASEIIDTKKCKITYMKAIAKVHPDKVSSNATVEQRMLASRVFTILNQAWDIFRTANNL